MNLSDLSDVPYSTLKLWRDDAEYQADAGEYDAGMDADLTRQWMAELNAEIARRVAPEPVNGG